MNDEPTEQQEQPEQPEIPEGEDQETESGSGWTELDGIGQWRK